MAKKLLVLITLTLAASALVLLVAGPTQPAGAQAEEKAARGCDNPGFYSGIDTSGDFQAALEDAIGNAEACAGCCDQRVSYEVFKTEGQRGGFLFIDEIEVTIEASW